MTALENLLTAIRKYEAPKGYGQIYGGMKGVPPGTNVAVMKLRSVRALQDIALKAGSKSSAVGGYQFIKKTLIRVMADLKLTGDEMFASALQDRMAIHLMNGRGYQKYMAGSISAEAFCNNLAMEWASLPVVTVCRGQNRIVQPGETFYAGDGLNRAHHKPETILALVRALKDVAPVPKPVVIPPAPEVPAYKPEPSGFWAWINGLFA